MPLSAFLSRAFGFTTVGDSAQQQMPKWQLGAETGANAVSITASQRLVRRQSDLGVQKAQKPGYATVAFDAHYSDGRSLHRILDDRSTGPTPVPRSPHSST